MMLNPVESILLGQTHGILHLVKLERPPPFGTADAITKPLDPGQTHGILHLVKLERPPPFGTADAITNGAIALLQVLGTRTITKPLDPRALPMNGALPTNDTIALLQLLDTRTITKPWDLRALPMNGAIAFLQVLDTRAMVVIVIIMIIIRMTACGTIILATKTLLGATVGGVLVPRPTTGILSPRRPTLTTTAAVLA